MMLWGRAEWCASIKPQRQSLGFGEGCLGVSNQSQDLKPGSSLVKWGLPLKERHRVCCKSSLRSCENVLPTVIDTHAGIAILIELGLLMG